MNACRVCGKCYHLLLVMAAAVLGRIQASSLAQRRWTTPVAACIRGHNLDNVPLTGASVDECRAYCEVHADCCAIEYNNGRCARSSVKRGAKCPDGTCYTQPCYGYKNETYSEIVDKCNGAPASRSIITTVDRSAATQCHSSQVYQRYCGSCDKTCNATGQIGIELCSDIFLQRGQQCPQSCVCKPGYLLAQPSGGRAPCLSVQQCAAGCKDTWQYGAKKCHEWKRAGFCDSHEFVKKHCRVTCDLCAIKTSSPRSILRWLSRL